MSNAAKQVRCPKCPDTSPGHLPWMAHRHNGDCYMCEATGYVAEADLPAPGPAPVFRHSLDFKVAGEVMRAYETSTTRECGDVVIIRPDEADQMGDDLFFVGTLRFKEGRKANASIGFQEYEIVTLPLAEKRKIFAAALEVFRAASK